ncbi:hypothetical protein CSE16_10055 [Solibacillus sp. R5-41]|uniref:hypothetical protein n=1 Tax=Solibacillus sp. R5-41 TaxID=2048654 RepID=UPI000C1264D1|nr:hypothetical protein [Solibacillus sp. R5-41]ATP40361.1 hypothetical protein CSE16_10055 [Solibacillus sp. R5-41]
MKKIIVGIIIVGILGIGIYLYYSEPTYSATDVLKRADFSVEEQTVEVTKFDLEVDGVLVPIELTDTTQKKMIKAFEKSKFKKDDSISFDNDYLMKITLNTGYFMFMDITGKRIAVEDNRGSYDRYLFEDDKFFSILEKAMTE